jgi:hypothetical protein
MDIFVNDIIDDNGVTHGIAVWNKTVLKNINLIYSGNKLTKILSLIENPPKEGFYFFDKFCQYVVFVHQQPVLGLSMKFTDFQNNDDLALDEYLLLKEKQWQQHDREKIMQLFHDIKTKSHDNGNLIIENQVQ